MRTKRRRVEKEKSVSGSVTEEEPEVDELADEVYEGSAPGPSGMAVKEEEEEESQPANAEIGGKQTIVDREKEQEAIREVKSVSRRSNVYGGEIFERSSDEEEEAEEERDEAEAEKEEEEEKERASGSDSEEAAEEAAAMLVRRDSETVAGESHNADNIS